MNMKLLLFIKMFPLPVHFKLRELNFSDCISMDTGSTQPLYNIGTAAREAECSHSRPCVWHTAEDKNISPQLSFYLPKCYVNYTLVSPVHMIVLHVKMLPYKIVVNHQELSTFCKFTPHTHRCLFIFFVYLWIELS